MKLLTRSAAAGCLFFASAAAAAPARPPAPRLTQGDFQEGGVPGEVPVSRQAAGVRLFGSWGAHRDQGRGRMSSPVFDAPEWMSAFLSGAPMKEGIRLYLEDAQTKAVWPLVVSLNPAQRWMLFTWRLPAPLRGRPCRYIVEDESAEVWVGTSSPFTGRREDSFGAVNFPLNMLLRYFLMLAPGLCACLWLLERRDADPISLLGVCAVATGLASYIVFWAHFLGPTAGVWAARALNASCLAWVWSSAPVPRRRLAAAGEFWSVIAVSGSFALFYASVGYLYGGYDHHFSLAASRFSHMLPGDNLLPYVFARRLQDGVSLRPFVGDWLSSDRPPLQAALFLWQIPFGDAGTAYQATGILAQQFFVWGLWLLLRELEAPPAAAALTLATCLLSGFFCLNSFFVWPKLLPAGFALIGAAFLLRGRKGSRFDILIAGASFALAMLGHEGSVFGLATLALFLAVMGRLPSWKRGALLVGLIAVLVAPWKLYAKLSDPPGNRLVKWHLANAPDIDARSTWAALRESYGSTPLGRIVHNKVENLVLPAGIPDWVELGRALARDGLLATRQRIRAGAFYFLTHAMGWLNLGLPVYLALLISPKRRKTPVMRAAGFLLLYGAANLVVWALAMYGPGTTALHAGSYVVPIVFQAGLALSLYALSPSVLVAALALRLVSFAAIWLPMLPLANDFPDGILAAQLDPAAAVVAALAFCEAALLLVRLGRLPQAK